MTALLTAPPSEAVWPTTKEAWLSGLCDCLRQEHRLAQLQDELKRHGQADITTEFIQWAGEALMNDARRFLERFRERRSEGDVLPSPWDLCRQTMPQMSELVVAEEWISTLGWITNRQLMAITDPQRWIEVSSVQTDGASLEFRIPEDCFGTNRPDGVKVWVLDGVRNPESFITKNGRTGSPVLTLQWRQSLPRA